MYTSNRRYRKPLGHFIPESKIELHAEKAMFRHNAQILRDMCDRYAQQRKQKQQLNIFGDVAVSDFLRKSTQSHFPTQYNRAQEKVNCDPKISPDVRWLLTRSARIQRVNNAGYATFRNRIKDRVVSADGRKKIISLERQRSMCSRGDLSDDSITPRSRQQRLQCDVLGPKFCTDCTEINQKSKILRNQSKSFPRIEVHTRSLVAPEKVEKIYLTNSKQLFHQDKQYPCGCTFDARLEITTPIVYTPHEVFERLRRKKQVEMIANKQAECVDIDVINNTSPTNLSDRKDTNKKAQGTPLALEHRPTFYEEKTEPPMDLSVSVKIISHGSPK